MNMKHKDVSYLSIQNLVDQLARKIKDSGNDFDLILGIARGGCIPSTMLSYRLNNVNVRMLQLSSYTDKERGEVFMEHFDNNCLEYIKQMNAHVLIVDDLSDSGHTFSFLVNKFLERGIHHKTAALYRKEHTKFVPDYYAAQLPQDVWIHFPWEWDRRNLYTEG